MNACLQTDHNELVVPSRHTPNPVPPRRIRMNHTLLYTRTSEGARRVVVRERHSNGAHCSLRRTDFEAEGVPLPRPLRREHAQRRREADIDILQIADLGHDCPSSTSLTKDLDTANISLRDPSAPGRTIANHDSEETLLLTVKELVGPVAHACACEIRGSFVYGA